MLIYAVPATKTQLFVDHAALCGCRGCDAQNVVNTNRMSRQDTPTAAPAAKCDPQLLTWQGSACPKGCKQEAQTAVNSSEL